jgi:hypothetical protein
MIPPRHVPVFLEGYKAFEELHNWKWGGTKDEGRHYYLTAYGRTGVKCTLSWKFDAQGSTQLAGIDKMAPSGEEAVWLALEEFNKWLKARAET